MSGMAVGEPLPEEQAATNKTRSVTPGQKKPARRILELKNKKAHPKSGESWIVVSNNYGRLLVADGLPNV